MKHVSRFLQYAAVAAVAAGIAASASAADIKTYLLLGQSHILGHGANSELATLAPGLENAQLDVAIWNSGGPSGNPTQNNASFWVDLQPGLGHDSTMFGSEISFGRDMADADGEYIALIKHAVGGTSLANDWKPGSGFAWNGMVDAINNAIGELDPGDSLDFMGVVWMQGGTDAGNKKNSNAYEQNLRNFIQALRDLTGVADLPVVIGEHIGGGRYANKILTAQYNVTGVSGSNPVSNTALIPLPGGQNYPTNPAPLGHWNADGNLQFGHNSGNALLGIPFPPVSAPTVAITSPSDGSQFGSGSTVSFTGVANDAVDGDLSGLIYWYVDNDTVPFFIGANTPAQSFVDGSYLITAIVENSATLQTSDSIGITVGTPPVAYVYTDGSVGYATSPTGGKPANRHKHLSVTLQVTDGNGAGVSGAAVNIDLALNGGYQVSLSGTTGSGGTVTVTYSNAPSGNYTTTVTSVSAAGYTWDGAQPSSDPGFTK